MISSSSFLLTGEGFGAALSPRAKSLIWRDAGFGQFRSILKNACKKRGVFVGVVDHKGTSQTCPNCRITLKKELSDRVHSCPECHCEVDRDIASAQELLNRGLETYRGTPEKQ